MSMGLPFGKVLELLVTRQLHSTVNVLNATKLYTLKSLKWQTLCVFDHIFKWGKKYLRWSS